MHRSGLARHHARQGAISDSKAYMIKAISFLALGIVAAITNGCVNNPVSGTTAESAAAQRDYERLSGTWQLIRGVVNGKPVPASVARNTILITDHNTSRFQRRAA
jgi:hypothetical protein